MTTEQIDFEVDGVNFVMHVSASSTGLHGQVFDGDEKVAGLNTYHRDDREELVRQARSDRAVLRAVARRTAS